MKTDFDFERAAALMDIMQKVSSVAPKSMSIFGLAQSELDDMNDAAKDIARAHAAELEAKRVEEAKRLHEEAKARAVPARQLQAEPEEPTVLDQPAPNLTDRRV